MVGFVIYQLRKSIWLSALAPILYHYTNQNERCSCLRLIAWFHMCVKICIDYRDCIACRMLMLDVLWCHRPVKHNPGFRSDANAFGLKIQ